MVLAVFLLKVLKARRAAKIATLRALFLIIFVFENTQPNIRKKVVTIHPLKRLLDCQLY